MSKEISNKVQSSINMSDGLAFLSRLTRPRSTNDELESEQELDCIKKEVDFFMSKLKIIINEPDSIELKSTASFWLAFKDKMPNLFRLSLKLLSIPVTSSHIERFFSIAGKLSDQKSSQITSHLLIQRAMLKANFNLLDQP